MNDKYIVVSIRKSDGKMYLPDNKAKRYSDINEAQKEAERKSAECSTDYYYSVVELTEIVRTYQQIPPIVVMNVTNNMKWQLLYTGSDSANASK